MTMRRLFPRLLHTRLLLDALLSRHIEFWIFLSLVACHQLEIHLFSSSNLMDHASKLTHTAPCEQFAREIQELFTLSHRSTDTRRLTGPKLITFWIRFQVCFAFHSGLAYSKLVRSEKQYRLTNTSYSRPYRYPISVEKCMRKDQKWSA